MSLDTRYLVHSHGARRVYSRVRRHVDVAVSRGRGGRAADGAARGHAGPVPAVLGAGAGYDRYNVHIIADILDISTVIDSISRHPIPGARPLLLVARRTRVARGESRHVDPRVWRRVGVAAGQDLLVPEYLHL